MIGSRTRQKERMSLQGLEPLEISRFSKVAFSLDDWKEHLI